MTVYNTALRHANQAYGGTQVSTAPQKKLILMLYEGAISNLKIAEQALTSGNLETAHQKNLKTQLILEELMVTLNFDTGGKIAKDLYNLYEYFHWALIQANIRKDPAQTADVRQYLEELKMTWQQI